MAYAFLALPVITLAIPPLVTVVELQRASKLPIPFPETRGLSIRADAAEDVLAMRKVVDYLERESEVPLLLLNNDAMMLFLSHRRPLFPVLDLYFQLMGDGMLRSEKLLRGEIAFLLSNLQGDPVVVIKDDETTRALRRYLPGVFAYVDRQFEPALTAGRYTVLRRSARPVTPPRSEPAA